jgi:hypothetical protein
VLLDIDHVRRRAEGPISPTQSIQPVSTSDMMSGSVLEIAPLEGDDFQSLLTLLPGVVRGPDGRLRAKGGQPTQGALQISSASLVDPSTGDFDLELPGSSLESVEMLANPFAAEYGRFSTSVTRIDTKRGTNEWRVEPGNPCPASGKGSAACDDSSLFVRGPLQRIDRSWRRTFSSATSTTGQKSAGRAGNRAHELPVHPNRQRALRHARRSRRHVPAQYLAFDDERSARLM